MARWRTRHRGSRAERGAAAVEFAIVLVVLLLILLGIIDFGRLLFVSQAVKSASREGARAAAVNAPLSTIRTKVNDSGAAALTGAGQALRTTVTTTYTPTPPAAGVWPPASTATGAIPCADVTTSPSGVATSVKVDVVARFQWLTPIGLLPLPGGEANNGPRGSRDVTASTTMRCE